ncbi:MAG: ATP synthase F1 subunit delta [Chloroflexi bacterium]|nr:ATP synthase F1 subunit delta [Chloroflexota bacterium]
MLKGAVARRYAEGVFSIAVEKDTLEEWRDDLEVLSAVLSQPGFVIYLENPKTTSEEKRRTVAELLEGRIQPLALNLAFLLINRNRTNVIGKIADEYNRMMDEHLGVAVAEVTTAVPLSSEQEKDVIDHLKQLTGKQIKLEAKVDPGIIGGLLIRIGDKLVDGSVATRLTNLMEAIA